MGIVLVVTVTFLVIQRHVHALSSGEKLLVAMVTRSTRGAKETCADLQFHGFRDGETATVEEKTYFNVTFYINTTKCTTIPNWFRVKVSYHQANFTVDVCSIIFEPQKCEITDQSSYCLCVNDLNAQLYREFKMSGNVSYIWSLSDTLSGQMQKKAQIIFDVSRSDKVVIVDAAVSANPVAPVAPVAPTPPAAPQRPLENVDVKTPERPQPTPVACTTQRLVQSSLGPLRVHPGDTDVSTPAAAVNTEGVNLQVIFFNSIITACVIGIPISIVITIYIYRRRKASATAAAAASESQPPADFRPRPQEPDTTMGIKRRVPTRARLPSAREEAEYTEIDYELQDDGTYPMLAHENYEHPLHKQGEDQSEYSKLEYKALWHSGIRTGPDSKQTKMDVPSPSAPTLKELPDDYLEPVPLTADKKT